MRRTKTTTKLVALVAAVCALAGCQTHLRYDNAARLRAVSKAIARRRARDTAAMFDATLAANGDEKALGRINKDLRAAEE